MPHHSKFKNEIENISKILSRYFYDRQVESSEALEKAITKKTYNLWGTPRRPFSLMVQD